MKTARWYHCAWWRLQEAIDSGWRYHVAHALTKHGVLLVLLLTRAGVPEPPIHRAMDWCERALAAGARRRDARRWARTTRHWKRLA